MAEHGVIDEIVAERRAALPFQRLPRTAVGPELALLSRLQTSLEPVQVLGYYFEALQDWLGLSGLEWRSGEECVRLGRAARCRHVYRLTLEDEFLGELTVSRRTGLDEQECLILEQSSALLIYPLRNALLYRQALTAARQDTLTGLGNRAALNHCLQRELELALRHDTPFSLILLDVDGFKHINDSYGHLAGDCVLTALAGALRQSARASDLLFRYAGDEFVVAMSHTDRSGALIVANRLRELVASNSLVYAGNPISVRISLGVAVAVPGEESLELFRRVDEALLAAKRAGRDRVALGA